MKNIKLKYFVTGLATLLIISLYLWQNFNGGVPNHHILGDEKLPQISNWWGIIVIPILTYGLVNQLENRLTLGKENKQKQKVVLRFVGSIIFGIVLVVSFFNDYRLFLDNLIYIIILISFFVPIYYAECILGFVYGTTYSLGAVLPAIFIAVFAAIGYIIYRYIKPFIIRVLIN